MSIFTKPIDQITFDDVESFCKEGVRENVRVDYKKDFSYSDANKANKQVNSAESGKVRQNPQPGRNQM